MGQYMRLVLMTALSLLALGIAAVPALASALDDDLDFSSDPDSFGDKLVVLGLQGSGQHLLVSDPSIPLLGESGRTGAVWVIDLKLWTVVRVHSAPPGTTRFGRALANLGDADDDGVDDYLVDGDAQSGRTGFVFSGMTGAQMGQSAIGERGCCAIIDSRANRDRTVRLASLSKKSGPGEGVPDCVVLEISSPGSSLPTIATELAAEKTNLVALAQVPDANDDSVSDIVVAEMLATGLRVTILSGLDASRIRSHSTRFTDWGVVPDVFGIPDVNGDSFPDLVLGDPASRVEPGLRKHRVVILSGADGVELKTHRVPPYERLLFCPGFIDGTAAVLCAQPTAFPAVLRCFLMSEEQPRSRWEYRLAVKSNVRGLGSSMVMCEDLDGDSVQELLAGELSPGTSMPGALVLLSGSTGKVLRSMNRDSLK